jgi:hypothetical protein
MYEAVELVEVTPDCLERVLAPNRMKCWGGLGTRQVSTRPLQIPCSLSEIK